MLKKIHVVNFFDIIFNTNKKTLRKKLNIKN